MDEIFGRLKPKKKKTELKEEKVIESKEAVKKKKKVKKKDKKKEQSKITKRTEDGYKIYKLEDLNLGKGGNTPDCPFDCQCCF